MQGSLISQGVELMLVGMGTVFVFLSLLVLAMTLMSRLVSRLHPPQKAEVTDEELAVISVAVARYRGDI